MLRYSNWRFSPALEEKSSSPNKLSRNLSSTYHELKEYAEHNHQAFPRTICQHFHTQVLIFQPQNSLWTWSPAHFHNIFGSLATKEPSHLANRSAKFQFPEAKLWPFGRLTNQHHQNRIFTSKTPYFLKKLAFLASVLCVSIGKKHAEFTSERISLASSKVHHPNHVETIRMRKKNHSFSLPSPRFTRGRAQAETTLLTLSQRENPFINSRTWYNFKQSSLDRGAKAAEFLSGPGHGPGEQRRDFWSPEAREQ